MLRTAMLTTVPSSSAMPEPSTAAVSTHRPCGVPRASLGVADRRHAYTASTSARARV